MCALSTRTMSHEPSDREVLSVFALTASDRYEFFIDRVADYEEVWSASPGGTKLLMPSNVEGKVYVPVWPHKKFAEVAVAANFPKARVRELDFEKWMEELLPKYAEDGVVVAVFPNRNWDGVFEEAAQVKSDIESKLEEYK